MIISVCQPQCAKCASHEGLRACRWCYWEFCAQHRRHGCSWLTMDMGQVKVSTLLLMMAAVAIMIAVLTGLLALVVEFVSPLVTLWLAALLTIAFWLVLGLIMIFVGDQGESVYLYRTRVKDR